MIARFEAHVHGCTPSIGSGGVYSVDFRVSFSRPAMITLTHESFAVRNDGSNQRIWRGSIPAAFRQPPGALHQRCACQTFLSPIRTITVGAGIRFV